MSLAPPALTPGGPGRAATSYVIRPFEASDAPGVCDLFALTRWGPFRDGHGFDAADLLRGIEEQGFIHFFVATVGADSVVGVLALTCSSVQRPSRAYGVFGDHFVIHPAFRTGPLARELMLHAEAACYVGGYRRADAHVDHDNVLAQRLYRRTGFRLVSAEPCEHGCLLLESHLPLVIRYLLEHGLAGDELVERLLTPRGLVELLPSTGRRANAVDVIAWHGSEVVPYEVRLAAGPLTMLVDRVIDAVTAVSGPTMELACWPEGGRTLATGATARIHYRVRNLAPEPAGVDITEPGTGHMIHAEVSPAGECRGIIAIEPHRAGRHDVTIIVEIDGAAGRSPIRLPLQTWFELEPQRTAQVPRPDGGFAPSRDGWIARSGHYTVTVDAKSGATRIWRDDQLLAEELWPDVGPPFPGGYEDPIARVIEERPTTTRGELVLASAGNAWVSAHSALRERNQCAHLAAWQLRRHLQLRGDGSLRVQTYLEVPPGTYAAGATLRTWIRSCLKDPQIVLASAYDARPETPRAIPYQSPNFEFVRTPDRYFHRPANQIPWTAVFDDRHFIGVVHRDATELRYGGAWMPSVLYHRRIEEGTPGVAFPDYQLVAGFDDPVPVLSRLATEETSP